MRRRRVSFVDPNSKSLIKPKINFLVDVTETLHSCDDKFGFRFDAVAIMFLRLFWRKFILSPSGVVNSCRDENTCFQSCIGIN